MKGHLCLFVALLMLTAGLAVACGDGNDAGDGESANEATPGRTGSPAPTADGATSTPTTFERLRDSLSDRLDQIGVNIGAVPDDVRDQILASCRELAAFAQRERVEEICGAIEQAVERGDPGLIDLILDQLAELRPD